MPLLNSKTIRRALDWETILKESTGTGNDKSFTVPSGKEWKLQSVRLEFTGNTGSTADRQAVLEYQSSAGNTIYEAIAGAIQNNSTASAVTRNYDFGPYEFNTTAFRDTNHLTVPITPVILGENHKFRLFDNNNVSTADTAIVRASVLERDEPSTST